MQKTTQPNQTFSGTHPTGSIVVGVVGLGLMGSSIVVSLLLAGHEVKAIAPIPADQLTAHDRIKEHLAHCEEFDLLTEPLDDYFARLSISEDYQELKNCQFVLECVSEIPAIKKEVYQRIEAVISKDAVIATNTSAIPISTLQKYLEHPARFLGVHWAEPAFATRFLEITCGEDTEIQYAEWTYALAHRWQKEPTLLKKDIRGFITNRLMYAIYRETFALIERGETTMEDADKALRYDFGSWITLMGIFRRMDFMGLENQKEIFDRVFPTLSNQDEVPAIMQKMVDINARGIHNSKGLFPYTGEEAKKWEAAFTRFNRDIYRLAEQYPIDKIET